MITATPDCLGKDARPAAVLPLIASLRQLADVIHGLTEEQYRTNPVGLVAGSVGGHVRHCLDHVDALLAGVEHGTINYDQRQRGTDIETSRAAALAAIDRHRQRLLSLAPSRENASLRLKGLVSTALPPAEVATSVGRELIFVLSHTIHHNALVAVIAKTLGAPLPEQFGYAPATLAYLEQTACTR